MAYNIFKADGTLISVPDNAISDEFYNGTANGAGRGVGLQLVGRNVVGYGAAIAQDLLQIASSFASATVPADATSLQGQLWFNLTDFSLYVRLNNNPTGGIANWKQVGGSAGPQIGEPLYDPAGTLIGYSTPAIPLGESVTGYTPMASITGIFMGWLRVTAGGGMTLDIRAPDNSIIGFAFPV